MAQNFGNPPGNHDDYDVMKDLYETPIIYGYDELEKNKKSNTGTFIKVALIFGIGVFLLLVGVFNLIQTKSFLNRSETTIGHVTKCERYTTYSHSRGRHSRRRTYTKYRIYVDYEVNGKTYSGLYDNEATLSKSEGAEVTVHYDPRNPGKFSDGRAITTGTLLAFVLGGIFALYGGYLIILYRVDPDDVEYALAHLVRR